jgi:cysteine desulfurase
MFWNRQADRRRRRILASAVEHHAVLDPVQWLADHEQAEVTWLPVDENGAVDPMTVHDEVARDPESVALLTVMWANNEVGTVQAIEECAAAAAAFGVPVHSDAVQAAGILELNFEACGLDALTISAHKLGGPMGVGALLLSRDAAPVPLIHGGGQERNVRSGTLDTPSIAGFAAAASESVETRAERAPAIAALRDQLVSRVIEVVPDATLNGRPLDSGKRLPGNAHLSFPGCEGDSLLMLLDANSIFCSTGSACSAGVAEPSHVLLAMGASPAAARSSLRFSLGHTSTKADVDDLVAVIAHVVERARAAGRASGVGTQRSQK